MSRSLDAALAYARRGWPVFPCHTTGPRGCSCGHDECSSPAKHPRIAGGLKGATTDVEALTRWWTRWPNANVAIRTGTVSGLVVLDVDPDHGGCSSLDALLKKYGTLPDGASVRTGSNGRHLYFAHPGLQIRNNAGTRLGPGIDIRGEDGYVIAPPSRHVSGATYRWEQWGRDLPVLPVWLVDRLRDAERPRSPAVRQHHPVGRGWAEAAVGAEIALVLSAIEGQRNHTLNRASFCLGQVVAGTDLDPREVEGLLIEAGLAVGLTEREVRATVRSGMNAGLREPRYPLRRGMSSAGMDVDVDLCTIELKERDSARKDTVPERADIARDVPDLPDLA